MVETPERFSECFDLFPSPVMTAKPAAQNGWEIEYRNPAAAAVLAGQEEAFLSALAPALSSGAAQWQGELGETHLAAKLARYPGGRTLVLFSDITEGLHRQEERIKASQSALQSALDAANAANRAKTDFLSNMSHDIRTPLNAIIGMTTIAQAHMDERERIEDCIEKISLSSRHLLAIINDILDMSRIESGKMSVVNEPFQMEDLIHSLMAVFRPQAERKKQKLELDFSGIRHEQVKGDELRIQQVLLNILSNAVKFTPEGGSIAVKISETGLTGKEDGNYRYYEFVVQDSGIGMSPAFLEKIFLPFERDQSVHRIEGTGLGMTIAHNLVKMMNGEINVESEEGRGTRFTVTLPLEQEPEEDRLSALKGRRVLAADADAASLRNLQELFADLDMPCDTVSSGWEAKDLAAQAHMRGEDYFAILLAWHLPIVDGVQTCRELRAILGNAVPVFIMSSFEWTLTDDEMRKYGIADFLQKPLFRSRLGKALYAFTPEGNPSGAGSAGAEESFSGSRILLVEDNEINREIGIELIGMLGAGVECAEDGQKAFEIFRDSPPGRFDLIFMDIQMPVMDGYAATRAIRALPREDSRRIPIIAMSANAFVEDIQACRRAGMNGHVPKPVNMQNLADTLHKFLKEGAEVLFD